MQVLQNPNTTYIVKNGSQQSTKQPITIASVFAARRSFDIEIFSFSLKCDGKLSSEFDRFELRDNVRRNDLVNFGNKFGETNRFFTAFATESPAAGGASDSAPPWAGGASGPAPPWAGGAPVPLPLLDF